VTTAQGEKVREYLAGRGLNSKSVSDFQLGYSPATWEGAKQYLLERGFTEMELITAGLLIQGDDGRTHDRFRNRLMFPIQDQRGRVTGFGGRALDNETQPKYLNSPQSPVFDKSDTLYGIHLAAPSIRQLDLAVIVEGYMDVIVPHQYGFANIVASMGIAITDRQVTRLKRLTKNLVLALDPDEAGEEAMLRCIDYENSLGAEIRVIIVPGGKDPDELVRESPEAWRGLVEKATPVTDFAIERTASKLDMSTAKGKSTAVNSLMPIIARVRDDIRRDYYLTRLSKLTGIMYNKLESVLKNYLVQPRGERPKITPAIPLPRPDTASREDYCLALLLKNPGLKTLEVGLMPDYFQDSENREIYIAWQATDDLLSLKERLDPLVRDRVTEIEGRKSTANRIKEKYQDCVLLMRKDYLQGQEAMRREIFAMEAETSGHKAALAMLEQEGAGRAAKIGEAETQRAQARRRATK
jgi:DNA primase